MNQSEESTPESDDTDSSSQPRPQESADRLKTTVVSLANQVRPFPAFNGMRTIQAIELELPPDYEFEESPELGCVVLLPNGRFRSLT